MSWWWIVPLVVAAGWWLYLQFRLRFSPYREGEPADEEIDYEALADTLIREPAPLPIELPAPAPEPQNKPDMAQFQIAYDIVRGHEGGYQKKANDPGNKNSRGELVGTNWGINAQIYESYLKRPPTEQDMRSMPKHIAVMLYKQLYWDPIKGDDIRDQQVANILFDGHVNHGRWGIQMMQQTLGLRRDGIVGPITLNAINRADPATLFNAYKETRRRGYEDLLRRRPWMENPWRRVWMNRIDSFYYRGPSPGGSRTLPTVNVNAQRSSAGQDGTITAVAIAVAAYFLLS